MTTATAAPPGASSHADAVKEILTSGATTACYYALGPDQRPDCQYLAVVCYGPTALCADCDRRRSAVGKAMAPVALGGPAALSRSWWPDSPTARQSRARADEALHNAVARARGLANRGQLSGQSSAPPVKQPSSASKRPAETTSDLPK